MGENLERESEWTTVRRRRAIPRYPPQSATRTIFVDFLPPGINPQTIRYIFLPHGKISDLVLPLKPRKNCSHRYAFVKFYSSQALLSAIHHENGRKIGNFTLRVNPAKYDTPSIPAKHHHDPRKTHSFLKQQSPLSSPKPATRDHRTYKEASQPSGKANNTQPSTLPNDHQTFNQPKEILEPHPKEFEKEMSNRKVMSSRVLGVETEQVREMIESVEFEGEQHIMIQGKRSKENEELFNRSVLGVANSSSSSELIHDHILAAGVTCLKIKPLGGMLHLITFDSVEDKEAIIESEWLLKWFDDIRNVNKSCAAIWRKTWINIYGMPLSAWCYDNFFKIGNIYGRVVSIDYTRMDCAKVMIITDCLFFINNPLIFAIDEEKFKLFVIEDNSTYPRHMPCDTIPNNTTNQINQEAKPASVSAFSSDEEELPKGSPKAHHWQSSEAEHGEKGNTINLGNDSDINFLDNSASKTPQKSIKTPSPKKIQKPPKYPTPSKTPIKSPNKSQPKSPYQCGLGWNNTNGPFPHSEPTLPSLENLKFSPPSPEPSIPLNLPPDLRPSPTQAPLLSPKTLSYENFSAQQPNNSSPKNKNTTLKSQSSSTSTSGPSVPPGFEQFIPSPIKAHRERKKLRKSQKRKENPQSNPSSSNHTPIHNPLRCPWIGPHDKTADEIIDLGLQMGMNYNGSLSELHSKIRGILARQEQDWTCIQ